MYKSKNNLFITALLAVSLISIQSISHADEFVKDNMPCVKEICIGDGLNELNTIKWDKLNVKPNPYMFESAKKGVTTLYRGKYDKIILPLTAKAFDNSTLKSLPDVKAQCDSFLGGLNGTFTSADKNKTTVTIELIPNYRSTDNSVQKWTVVSIEREYPAKSEQQRSQIHEINRDRYKSLTGGEGNGENHSNFYSNKLSLSLNQGSNSRERHSLHPDCGGSGKVKID